MAENVLVDKETVEENKMKRKRDMIRIEEENKRKLEEREKKKIRKEKEKRRKEEKKNWFAEIASASESDSDEWTSIKS